MAAQPRAQGLSRAVQPRRSPSLPAVLSPLRRSLREANHGQLREEIRSSGHPALRAEPRFWSEKTEHSFNTALQNWGEKGSPAGRPARPQYCRRSWTYAPHPLNGRREPFKRGAAAVVPPLLPGPARPACVGAAARAAPLRPGLRGSSSGGAARPGAPPPLLSFLLPSLRPQPLSARPGPRRAIAAALLSPLRWVRTISWAPRRTSRIRWVSAGPRGRPGVGRGWWGELKPGSGAEGAAAGSRGSERPRCSLPAGWLSWSWGRPASSRCWVCGGEREAEVCLWGVWREGDGLHSWWCARPWLLGRLPARRPWPWGAVLGAGVGGKQTSRCCVGASHLDFSHYRFPWNRSL